MSSTTHEAVREFEQANKLASTGEVTQGLLRRLRDISKASNKWGMSWALDTRKAAVASARASCGDAASCPVEISFFGTECGVFTYSESSWAIVARADMAEGQGERAFRLPQEGQDMPCRRVRLRRWRAARERDGIGGDFRRRLAGRVDFR